MHPGLVRERLDALAAVTQAIDEGRGGNGEVEVALDGEAGLTWMRVLNDARLTLGVRLGVTEDLDPRRRSPDSPDALGFAVYDWLTWLQSELIDALAKP